ncbi:MAG: GNAT family N-acetyltransferase [Bacteroides sp.]|nr:GNAT family N-acetyltransferase [Bacteroides sp.]
MKSYLTGRQVCLRAMEPEDLAILYEIENDPAMWEVSSFTVPYSRYALKQYISLSQNDVFSDKQLRLMIADRADRRVVGTIDITDFVPLHGRGAVGIAVLAREQGKGYAAEALQLLCEYALGFLRFRQLYAHIPVSNEASLRLFSKAGFVRCGLLREWIYRENRFEDTVLMQLLAETPSESNPQIS